MTVNLPPKVRFGLYVATVIGSPIIGYLNVVGTIGANEVALWTALTAAVAALAAFNVSK